MQQKYINFLYCDRKYVLIFFVLRCFYNSSTSVPNQCFLSPQIVAYPDLSLFLRTFVKKKNEAQTVVTIDSTSGEVASFDITNSLDQKVILMGIPVPNRSNEELVMSLQFQFIQLIRKGEQKND